MIEKGLFIQGDRDGIGLSSLAFFLAGELNHFNAIALVGHQGKLVEFMEEYCTTIRHEVTEGSEPRLVSWARRLDAWMEEAQGFLFFPGREGTAAHLAVILAFEKKKPVADRRRILIYSVDRRFEAALALVFDLTKEDLDAERGWIRVVVPHADEDVRQRVKWVLKIRT